MQITRTLKVTSDEFYDNLIEGIWKDIKENADKRYRKMDIQEGFKYTKNAKHGAAKQEFEILEFRRGESYKVIMRQYADYLTISYKTKETSKGLEVTMEQYLDSFENDSKRKNSFFVKWSRLVYYSRMAHTLYDLESDIEYGRDNLKRPKEDLIPEHYKKVVKNINKQVLTNSAKRERKLEQKKRIEAKKAKEAKEKSGK